MRETSGASMCGRFFGIFEQLSQLKICDGPQGDLYGPELAMFYERFVGTFVGDLPIFQRLLPQPDSRVLDLACGTARIALGLARAGAHVHGIELSSEMISLGESKLAQEAEAVRARVRLYHGDITKFDTGERYALITLGVTSISLLLTKAARRMLFDCVRNHLAEGGLFAFDILDLDEDRWLSHDNFMDVWSREDDDGLDVSIVGQKFYPDDGVFIFNVYREIISWTGETRRMLGHSTKAWLRRDPLVEELSEAGLVIQEEFREQESRYFVCRLAQEADHDA